MKNKSTVLLSLLIGVVIMIEGGVLLSKPKIIVRGDSFSPENSVVAPKKLSPTSSLALELLGTAIGNPKDPIAFIKDLKANKQGMYKLGNVIQEAKIVQIAMGEVTLDLNGKQEILKLSKRGRDWAGISADEIVLSKSDLLKESANIYAALSQVTAKPHYQAEKIVGLQVEGIPENSIANKAGIKNQDIVQSINNQKIDSYQKALQVFSKVKNQSRIEISLLRGGQPLSLYYQIRN